jgi:hypothetical protein
MMTATGSRAAIHLPRLRGVCLRLNTAQIACSELLAFALADALFLRRSSCYFFPATGPRMAEAYACRDLTQEITDTI